MSKLIMYRCDSEDECSFSIYDDEILDRVREVLEDVKRCGRTDFEYWMDEDNRPVWSHFVYTYSIGINSVRSFPIELSISFGEELSDLDREAFLRDVRDRLDGDDIYVGEL